MRFFVVTVLIMFFSITASAADVTSMIEVANKSTDAALTLAQHYYTNKDYENSFKWYSHIAATAQEPNDNALAKLMLGDMYRYGYHVARDYAKAETLYKEAAESLPVAWYTLGELYFANGAYNEALKAYNQARLKNYIKANTAIGNIYQNGYGVAKNINEAIKYYEVASNGGDSTANAILAAIYYRGLGVDKNLEKAFVYALKSAEQNNIEGEIILGTMYYELGRSTDAFRQFEKAATSGSNQAIAMLMEMYIRGVGTGQNIAAAIDIARYELDKGNPAPMGKLAEIYLNGEIIPQNLLNAAEYAKIAAKNGDAAATSLLGFMYYGGVGVQADKKTAVALWQNAAKKGDVNAINALGDLFYMGDTVQQDYNKALSLYKMAADAGYAPAKFSLGKMYYEGVGVEQNSARGLALIKDAALADEEAKSYLESIR